MVNGNPITDYAFKPQVASITYTMAYELEQARLHAGMSVSEWDALPGTMQWTTHGERCKSELVMLYRMSNLIPAAAQDAAARDMERQSKLKGRH